MLIDIELSPLLENEYIFKSDNMTLTLLWLHLNTPKWTIIPVPSFISTYEKMGRMKALGQRPIRGLCFSSALPAILHLSRRGNREPSWLTFAL
jgi:hypothetical protein